MNNPTQLYARFAGVAYLLTFVSSIPAVFLLAPVLQDSGFITGGPQFDRQVIIGNLLDTTNAMACVASALFLYPILRERAQVRAIGFLSARLFEAAIIMMGVVSLLATVSLRQLNELPNRFDPATITSIGEALLAVRDWTFLLGPGLIPAFNALMLATVLYQFKMVPRLIPLMGMIGAPLLIVSAVSTAFGLFAQDSVTAAFAALPIALWEFSVALWLIFKGIKGKAA